MTINQWAIHILVTPAAAGYDRYTPVITRAGMPQYVGEWAATYEWAAQTATDWLAQHTNLPAALFGRTVKEATA